MTVATALNEGTKAADRHSPPLGLDSPPIRNGAPICHVSALPGDFPGREAVIAALDLVSREMGPLAATFSLVGERGSSGYCAVHGRQLPPSELAREMQRWQRSLCGIDPLAPTVISSSPGRIVTLADLGDARRVLRLRPALLRAYRRIGALDDVRLPIRDGRRLLATIALWRPLRSRPWARDQLRLLEALQPLIEGAYLAARGATPAWGDRLPATLTRRQREVAHLLAAGAADSEVARALRISPHTVKSHARAVLSKAGVASRRELMFLVRGPGARS